MVTARSTVLPSSLPVLPPGLVSPQNRLLAQGACVLGVDKCAMPAADLPADAEKQFLSWPM